MATNCESRTAVIFDLDGVLIDSSQFHRRSWHLLADECGIDLPEGFFERTFGQPNRQIIPQLFDRPVQPPEITRLGDRKEELFRRAAEGRIRPLTGAVELARSLKQAGFGLAIASSTPRRNIEFITAQTRLGPLFDVTLCGDDVTRGKPDPEVFLLAAERLGRQPARCVVIEDALAGIEAARRADMAAVAITTTHPRQAFRNATWVVDSLTQLTPELLRRM